MNSEELEKKKKVLLSLIYDIGDASESGYKVYAKHYLRNVLLAMKAKENTLVFALDLNNMGVLNTMFSFDIGTSFMRNYFQTIHDTLPEGTVISRDGGDEFEFHVRCFYFKNIFQKSY